MIAAGYKLPVPQWESALRKCVQCGMTDSPVFSGELDAKGAPIFNHKVVIDLVYIDRKVLTPEERSLGFHCLAVGEDHAKVRTLCRECLDSNEVNHAVWLDFNKQRERDQEAEDGGNYYLTICT